ncbi:MAG TPA: XdhC family protein [Burkholderiales bacterium]|nr:XdhC family protein [Burkholderiales bacterium]
MRPDLLPLAASLSARGERFALVTVVRREPPSSARVGDTALITEGGEYHGWAGGGCTRETVVREAQRAMADGEPRFISLSPEASAPRPGMVALQMTCDSGGTVEIYVEPVLPVPRLVLFGATPAVEALARIGEAMNYRVERGPDASLKGAHVLVGTMGDEDLEVLQKVLRGEPVYVGVIASRKRFDQVRETLIACGVPRAAVERVNAPAGLDIGARTPEEIALSVMAQIIEEKRKHTLHAKPVEAVDPICGMKMAVAGARHVAEVEGKTYYFCCAGCRTRFLQKGVSA